MNGFKVGLVGMILTLTACGGNPKVVTTDDSADYKSARELPPLKKPSRILQTVTQAPPPVTPAPASSQPAPQPVPQTAATPTAQADDNIDVRSRDVAVRNAPVASVATPPAAAINARVVNPEDQIARLQMNASFDSAWAYVNDSLKRSDITVHSRNRAAGRIAIGCSDIDQAPAVVKRGGWSFFNRRPEEELEYCALQLVSSKQSTNLQVINRSGQEVSRASAENIFRRILNN